jgi:hypothetical protein
MWANVTTERYPGDTTFEATIEDGLHGGVGGGSWLCTRCLADEGVTWIQGWYTPSEPEAAALLAAGLLMRSAA